MKKTKPNHLIECIEKISETARKSATFSDENLNSENTYTKDIANYLGCSERQAFWFSILFSINLHTVEIDLEDISSFLKCSVITVFKYMDDFEELVKLKVVRRSIPDRHHRQCPDRLDSLKFYIPVKIIKSISGGEKKLPSRRKAEMSIYELLDVYSTLLQERSAELLTQEEFSQEVIALIGENQHLDFIKIVQGFKLSFTNLLILLFVSSQFTDFEDADLIGFLKIYFSNSSAQMKIRKEFMKGSNRLQELKLVDTPNDNFRSDRTIVLTENAKELLFGDDRVLFATQEQRKTDIILSGEILPQKLFFNKIEKEQLDILSDLLKPDNFKSVCGRMRDMGLRTGFNILLFGPAGTGKSATCLSLSNQTGRDLYKIDISSTKSKWFGDSERLIKGMFDRYAKMVANYELAPFMYLNECDGILSTRVNVESSVSQTQNSMQNLLLEGMESLNGIILATTNLTQNLDKAFERRFLYKIELKKPEKETRCLIIQDKIPGLSESDCLTIAEEYDLSGGQLENIARKSILHQVLTGATINLSTIIKFCDEEFLDKTRNSMQIGYLRSNNNGL
jgi:AAA+ superfamily predicted ATPase